MKSIRFLALSLVLAAPASAQAPKITLAPLSCLPDDGNAAMMAHVDPQPAAEVQVRLYFRRMNLEVEDFYYVAMTPIGGGDFWSVFPRPEETKFVRKRLDKGANSRPNDDWAEWWKAKDASDSRDPNDDLDKNVIKERAALGKREKRGYMAAEDNDALERWLERQTTEPAEYYVALYDPSGRQLAHSELMAVDVTKNCSANLTPQQEGFAKNMTVGETATWQKGKPVFHWQCTGIVTRIDPQNVLRADDACRACVVGWWPIAAAGAGALGVATIGDEGKQPGPEVSPTRP
ncbi:MAG: hypothetical protein U0X73_07315 [Thermoanaerobaculia bacterium]